MFATLKLVFVYILLGAPTGIIGIPLSILIGDISRLYRIVMWIVRAGLKAAGIKVDVSGIENVPPGQSCIFMSNHVSNLDPPVLLPLIPGQSSVLLKKELMNIPILGTAMRLGKFVPVERGNRREAAQESVATAAEVLRSGLHMLVYPEGTRSKDGRLSTFKKGPFFLAQATQATIIPVAISGTEKMMRRGSFAIYPSTARLQFLKPIEPKNYANREEMLRAVRNAIAEALPDEMKPMEA